MPQGIKLRLGLGLLGLAVLAGMEALLVLEPEVLDGTGLLVPMALFPVVAVIALGIWLFRNLLTHERQMSNRISAAERRTRNLKWEASHDPLTRLINRREFKRRAAQLCRQAEVGGSHHIVLFLDLDQFKSVNDTCGHAAGDALLRQLPTQLQDCLRNGDTLARIGGDEFGVLLPGSDMARGREVAKRLSKAVQDFRFVWHGRLFEIGVSIGAVQVDRDHSHLPTVFNAADTACYRAKRCGRNQIRVMESSDQALSENRFLAGCAHDIPQAIRENRLELYVQEIRRVDESEGVGNHYEVLVRMRNKDGELLPPDRFIPVAEHYGLAIDVDRWVVKTALEWMTDNPSAAGHRNSDRWPSEGCSFSINLSGQSLSNPAFLVEVLELFQMRRIDPTQVTFEVTETAVISNLKNAKQFIKALKGIGCRFALDDFGSGMSSFAYLRELDVDYVKIDGSLISKLARGGLENAMVVAIIYVARCMNARTVAEYVEDDMTERLLRGVGVDYLQGFLFHKPMPMALLNAGEPANESMLQPQLKLG